MASKLGSIFVELALDDRVYRQKLSEIQPNAIATAKGVETAWRQLGAKSDESFEQQRRAAQNAFTLIKNSASSTANDIIRAEEAKNAKLKMLNDQQYGAHVGMFSKLKDNWLATTAAIAAAWYAVNKTVGALEGIVMAAARYETMGVVMNVVGKNAGYSAAEMDNFARALEKTGISMTGSRESVTRMVQAQLDLNQSTKLARVAQDAAVIGNINSTEAFQRLVYGIQSAQVEMLRTIGINVSFENAYKRVAEETGRAKDSFSEAEKATIRMNAVLEAGEGIAGTYETAMGTAGKQLLSLERHFENLKVLAGQAFTPALAEVVDMITGSVTDLNGEMRNSSTVIPYVAKAVAGAVIMMQSAQMSLAKYVAYGAELAKSGPIIGMANLRAIDTYFDAEQKKIEDKYYKIADTIDKTASNTALSTEKVAKKVIDSHAKTTKSADSAAKKQASIWESGQKEYERIMDEEAAYSERTGNKEVDAAEKAEQKKYTKLDELLKKKAITEKQYSTAVAVIAQNTEDKKQEIWEKGQEEYERIMAEEGDFASTENERAINKIVAQEREKVRKIDKLYDEGKIDIEQYYRALVLIEENAAEAREESEINSNKKIADARYDMIKDIKGYEDEAYQYKLNQIETEKQERINKAGKTAEAEILAAKWAQDEQIKAFIAMGKAGDDWKNGILASLLETSRAHTTWGSTFYEITKTATDEAKKQLSDNFFKLFKGNFDQIDVDWESMLDSMLNKLSTKLADMVMEAAAEDIVLMFKSEWTQGGSQVLGIVNSVLGLAGNLFGDSPNTFDTSVDWTGGLGFASGGRVPGSPSNVDSVAAMLAPGEHVIPSSLVQAVAQQGRSGDTMLAHINPAEAAVLKMLGGSGTVNPATGLPEFFYDAAGNWVDYIDPVSGLIPDPVYVAPVDPFARGNQSLTYAVRNLPEVVKSYFLNSYLNTNLAGSIADYMAAGTRIGRNADGSYVVAIGNYGDPYSNASTYTISAAGSMTGWTPRHGLDTSSTFMSEYGSMITGGLSFLNPLLGLIAAPLVAGATVANDEVGWLDVLPTMLTSMAGTTLAMLGGYQGIGGLLKTGISGTGTAATHEGAHAAGVEAILAEMAEQYPSTFAGSIYDTWGNLIDTGFDMATNTVLKQGIKYAINSLFGGGGDASNKSMRLSYMGANDGGLLERLHSGIYDINGAFPFSARNGLDYVPRDNFKINAHEGEAVLNKKEAKQWREGGASVKLNIVIENFYGDSEGINALAEKVGDVLDNYNRKGWRA